MASQTPLAFQQLTNEAFCRLRLNIRPQVRPLVSMRDKVYAPAGEAMIAINDFLDKVQQLLCGQAPATVGAVPGPILNYTVTLEKYGLLTFDNLTPDSGADLVRMFHFLVMAIDETDMSLWGTGTMSGLDMATLTSTMTPALNEASRLGITFSQYDFIIWNDPVITDPDTNTSTGGGYEIDQIVAIDPDTLEWTLLRGLDIQQPTQGLFGSVIADHPADSRFYRLRPLHYTRDIRPDAYFTANPNTPGGLPTHFDDIVCPAACVAATAVAAAGDNGYGDWVLLNLLPVDPGPEDTFAAPHPLQSENPRPGLRTMTGAAYLIPLAGALSDGQTADFQIPIREWCTIQAISGRVETAPSGGDLVYTISFRQPREVGQAEVDRVTTLIETHTIASGEYTSFTDADTPDGRQMPYQKAWPVTDLGVDAGSERYVVPVGTIIVTVTTASGAAGLLVLFGN